MIKIQGVHFQPKIKFPARRQAGSIGRAAGRFSDSLAVGLGFEPRVPLSGTTVFKTAAFGRSATPPFWPSGASSGFLNIQKNNL